MEDSEPSLNILNLYIADGLTDDIDKLLGHFVKSGSLRYEAFVDIWKDTKFYSIFEGRLSFMELREFAEEALHVAKMYLTNMKNSLVMRVGALYIIYGMAYTLPVPQYSRIRVVGSECLPIEQLITWSREEQHYDVLYVWGRLSFDGVVQYHLTEREYGADRSLRKYYDVGKTYMYVRSQYNSRKHSVLSDLLESITGDGAGGSTEGRDPPVSWSQMDKLAHEYHHAKCQLNASSGRRTSKEPPRGLNYADPDLPTKLVESMKRLLQTSDATKQLVPGSSSSELKERRVEIKKRGAASKIVQPQHHVSAIDSATTGKTRTRRKRKSRKKCKDGENIPEADDTVEHPPSPIIEVDQEPDGENSDEDVVYVIEVQEDINRRAVFRERRKRHHQQLGIDPGDVTE